MSVKEESKTLVDGKYFRVHNISKIKGVDSDPYDLKVETLPIAEGLAIEKRGKDFEGKKNYYVVAFVKPVASIGREIAKLVMV